MANDLQRTPEWYLSRKNHITASECYVLLNNHKEEVPLTAQEQEDYRKEHPRAKIPETKKVDAPFSTGTYSYLDGKVAEMYMTDASYMEYLEVSSYETRAMSWGTEWESEARNVYSQLMGCEIVDAPFIPLKGYEKFAGGSPDGIDRDNPGIIEIKCPFNPANHLKHFLYEKPEDLLADNEQYYVQCQYNILSVERDTGRQIDYCDFISYDPRTSRSKQIKVMRIPKDAEMQEMLWDRTALAVEYMRQQIEKINNVEPIIK